MGWLLILLATALVAFFVVKTMKAATMKQQSQNRQLQQEARDNSPVESETQTSARLSNESAGSAGAGAGAGAADADASTSAVMGAAAVAGAAGIAAGASAAVSSTGANSQGINSGNTGADVVEMMKILNLAESDASRLNISRDAFVALRQSDAAAMPDAATVDDVASRLRKMLA